MNTGVHFAAMGLGWRRPWWSEEGRSLVSSRGGRWDWPGAVGGAEQCRYFGLSAASLTYTP